MSGLRNDTDGIIGNPYYGWRGAELRKEQVEKINAGEFLPRFGPQTMRNTLVLLWCIFGVLELLN